MFGNKSSLPSLKSGKIFRFKEPSSGVSRQELTTTFTFVVVPPIPPKGKLSHHKGQPSRNNAEKKRSKVLYLGVLVYLRALDNRPHTPSLNTANLPWPVIQGSFQ
ncbi:hypothetical protein Q8A73_013280 [Channa argus]|nr:hypothetical protein Q8A73_013280 [Channa argus]